jgi:hypothetical protein
MAVSFAGNAFIDGGYIDSTTVANTVVSTCRIEKSSIDMDGDNITSVKDPILLQDAATKNYVDSLGIVISVVSLNGTSSTLVSSASKGSFLVLVDSIVSNGPSAVFIVSKNSSTKEAHIVRQVATPGDSSNTTLWVSWPPGSGILLYKNGASYDGSYSVKIL